MLVESRKIALLIIMDVLFSVDIQPDLPRLWTPILKTIEFISPGPWIFFRHLPRPGFKKHIQTIDDYLYSIIANRRAALATSHPAPNDLLAHLLNAGLSDRLIRDQMLTMLIAGHDTSTALLAWTFALLGQHPETSQRLVHELDGALGSTAPTSPSGWQPRLLDDVIKESLRLYPPIHIGNRFTTTAMTFPKGQVPAGKRLFYSIYLTQRDPAYWDQPSSFCPERFSQGRKPPSFAYIPFGGGPRVCIGAAFGQAEARIVLARLLQTFHFELTEPNIRVHMGATLEPRPGVFMKVTHR
jgi:cytochrome P450